MMFMLAMSVTFAFSEKFVEQLRRIAPAIQPLAIRSGRRCQVRATACFNRQRWISAWLPALQHRRHRPAFELLRPRVMRPVEQPVVERLLAPPSVVPEHARAATAPPRRSPPAPGNSPPDST